MFTVQLVDILCCSVAYITSGQYCATWLTVVLNTCALSHFHRGYYSWTRWPDLMSTSSWMRLASTCRNEGKEAVTSLAKEPSLRFLANGGVILLFVRPWVGGACPPACCPWVLQHPTSPHLPRGAERHPPGPPTTPSWARTSHLCDNLGQCTLPQNKPNQRVVHHQQ